MFACGYFNFLSRGCRMQCHPGVSKGSKLFWDCCSLLWSSGSYGFLRCRFDSTFKTLQHRVVIVILRYALYPAVQCCHQRSAFVEPVRLPSNIDILEHLLAGQYCTDHSRTWKADNANHKGRNNENVLYLTVTKVNESVGTCRWKQLTLANFQRLQSLILLLRGYDPRKSVLTIRLAAFLLRISFVK